MPEEPDFTPRNVAKYVVQATVQFRTTRLVKNAIVGHTSLEKDSTPVSLVSNVIGWGVSAKLKPHTDKMVDKTADFVADKREKRQAKKDKKKNDQE